MEFETNVNVYIDLGDLAHELARGSTFTRNNYEGLHEFIVEIDEYVSDLEFTVALRDKLNEIIDRESE